jgi:hypothetical protein
VAQGVDPEFKPQYHTHTKPPSKLKIRHFINQFGLLPSKLPISPIPVIQATWEAEIGRIKVRSQLWQIL